MSRNIIKALAISCIVVLILVLDITVIKPIEATNKQKDEYLYHFQVIIDSEMNGKIREDFINELEEKGKENKAYIEVIENESKNGDKKELIEKGMYSKVAGIACIMDSKKMGNSMYKKTSEKKIPLVDYGMSNFNYDKLITIGPEEYDIGVLVANQISKYTEKKDKILVIENGSTDKKILLNKNIEKGFKKGIKESKRDNGNIKYIKVKEDMFGTKKDIVSILKENKKYKGLVILDKGFATLIGNMIENKEYSFLKDKEIVAYGESTENIQYLKNGVFKSVISYDAKDMADKLIFTLIDSKLGNKTRSYITNLRLVTFDEENDKIKTDVFNTEDSK